jgi:hypothetical protein
MAFVTMMQSNAGRIARAVVGLAMIAIGLALGGGWLAVAVVGLVPLAAGVFDFCLAAPLVHRPLRTAHGHRS